MKVDRSVLSLVPLFDESDAVRYWKSRTPAERLSHVETLRRINYGDRANGRMERFLEVARLPWL